MKMPCQFLKAISVEKDPNHYAKHALSSPDEEHIPLNNVPFKQYQFNRFMLDISKNAKCSKSYIPYCLRAIANDRINDVGFAIHKALTACPKLCYIIQHTSKIIYFINMFLKFSHVLCTTWSLNTHKCTSKYKYKF